MFSIFLAFLVHFLAPASIGGAAGHAAIQTPISSPGHYVHRMDSGGGPAD
jgi:hypothetical protein